MVSSTIPVVRVTVGGVTTAYSDNQQVLNTGGTDAAGCPATGSRNDESRTWQQIHPRHPFAFDGAKNFPSDFLNLFRLLSVEPCRNN